ncbi:metal-dependent transcriptional regulator [Allobaculum mucilyticum]|uniref:metal-dependent transcriptional regulator n=1 Tax=Allobaculum mucilyticum TaxID=2834459 RepID=UPI001E3B3046|nr:metal-dependent transcriptional regulator [Allobaculum mucilyticum]UNT96916.1 metal-dependent transcriptional regulator [Allobaculum mucilyticum]
MQAEKKDPILTESVEDYLESILVLSSQLPYVRSVDVASHLGFSKPSVSHAVKLLAEEGFIEVSPKKQLTLTEKGKEAAARTYQRHLFFTEMLTNIGVDPDIAAQDACRLEHCISQETFDAIVSYYNGRSDDASDDAVSTDSKGASN